MISIKTEYDLDIYNTRLGRVVPIVDIQDQEEFYMYTSAPEYRCIYKRSENHVCQVVNNTVLIHIDNYFDRSGNRAQTEFQRIMLSQRVVIVGIPPTPLYTKESLPF